MNMNLNMNHLPRKKEGYSSLLPVDYIELLPWRKKRPCDEEFGPDCLDDWSDTASRLSRITQPMARFSLNSDRDLLYLQTLFGDSEDSGNGDEVDDGADGQQSSLNQRLVAAIERKDCVAVEHLLKSGAEVNLSHGSIKAKPIHLAVAMGCVEAVDVLLRYSCSVSATDSGGLTPLHIAAVAGDFTLVEKLIAHGADVNCQDYVRGDGTGKETPLHRAVSSGNPICVEMLLKAGAQPNLPEARGRCALHFAASRGTSACIKILLEHEADPNIQDNRGTTALLLLGGYYVVRGRGRLAGYTESLQLLVKHKACVNVLDPETHITPLHQALSIGKLEAVKALIEAGASVNVQDNEGITPLHLAALKGSDSSLKVLLSAPAPSGPANVHKADSKGRTALHKAAYRGSAECIGLLLNAGADLGAKTNETRTSACALILQLPNGHKILRKHLDGKLSTNQLPASERGFRLRIDYSLILPQASRNQMNIIEDILDAPQQERVSQLLVHPLIESFLNLKWRRIKLFFYCHILLYLTLVAGITAFVLYGICQKEMGSTLHDNGPVGGLQMALSVFILMIIVQEVFQLASLKLQYFRDLESWLKIGALVSSTAVIFAATKEDWLVHVSAVAIFLGWAEIMLLLGRLPIFGVYALMFSSVTPKLVKLLGAFFCLIAGFAFSFHVLFQNKPAYADPWVALLRTTAFMVGDMDFDAYFFDENNNDAPLPLRATAYPIYLLFLVLMSVVLMNLLIGIAVSDIQGLQNEGHIKRLRKQAQFLVYLEDLILSRFIDCFFPTKFQVWLRSWFVEKNELIAYPAVRKMRIHLPRNVIERALEICESSGEERAGQISVRDLYELTKECADGLIILKEKIIDLEERLSASTHSGSTPTIANNMIHHEELGSNLSLSSQESLPGDEPDGRSIFTKRTVQRGNSLTSVQLELREIRRLLSKLSRSQEESDEFLSEEQ